MFVGSPLRAVAARKRVHKRDSKSGTEKRCKDFYVLSGSHGAAMQTGLIRNHISVEPEAHENELARQADLPAEIRI
jgi:hypothetical protein